MRRFIKHKKVIITMMLVVFIFGLTGNLVSAETRKEPSFDIEMKVNPKQAEVGEDITVTGTITPNDFELQEKEKEIVLVLDTSGSMNDRVYVPYYDNYHRCTGNKEKYCVRHNYPYCKECTFSVSDRSYDHYGNVIYTWLCDVHRQWSNYSTSPNKPSACSSYYLHDWRYDYCSDHGVEGIHTGTIRTTKIDELKKAAKAFVDKMQDVSNLKIAIVEFNNGATIKNDGFLNANDKRLYKSIDRLGADGATNTGDGLRKAAYLLSQQGSKDANKTVVLMSDGVPTYYSLNNSGNYYEELNNEEPPDVGGPGNRYNDYTIEYAELMGSKIKANNAYSIGYGLGDENSANNSILKGIHSSMSGNDGAFYASSDGAIEGIFSDIADKIKESYSLTKVELDTKISMDDFEISLPSDSNCKLDNQKIVIPDIVYKKQGNSNLYKANPIEFSYIIKGKKTGNYSLFKNKEDYIKLTYYDGENKKDIPLKSDIVVSIVDKIGCKTEIEVSDSAGVINEKDKYFNKTAKLNESKNRYELPVKNSNTENEYKLFGSAKASIKGEYPEVKEGENRILQYQFVEKNSDGKSIEDIKDVKADESQWKDINLDHETYNPDVGEEGKLTVRPYNVDHMKTKDEQSRWENRQEVFKSPSDSIERKSASIAKDISKYVSAVNVGQDYKLSSNTIFTESIKFDDPNQMEALANEYSSGIRERVKKLSAEYKEAYKYWGYFSPEESGYYLLGLLSDDGSIGTITVKGEPIIFSESFKVQSDTFTANSRVIYLEKGKYYPLNLEYFNWGGGAVFKMMYKNYGEKKPSNKYVETDIDIAKFKNDGDGFTSVSKDNFYSSNSNEPGESSTGKFTGVQGVSFPNKVGRYYIAYRVGVKDSENNIKTIDEQGVYGPFNISENVSLTREVIDDEKVDDYNEELGYIPHRVSLKYTIKPNDIDAREIYKGKKEGYAEKLFVSKYSITDNFIRDINPTSKSGDTLDSTAKGIGGTISKISYEDSTKINIDITNRNVESIKNYIYNDLINNTGWYNEEMKQLYDNASIESVAEKIASNTAKDVDIIYTLDKKDNTYKAEPISFETEILCDAEKSYELKRESTLSNYSDVIIRAIDRKLEVQNHVKDDAVINSVNYGKVIQHGVYMNNEFGILTKEDMKLNLAPGVPISAGVIVDAVGKCQLKIDEISASGQKGDINLSKAKVYKLDENNKIVAQVSEGLIINNDKKEISLDSRTVKGRYLILYTYDSKIDATGALELKASTLSDSKGKILKVHFDPKGLPDLF
ncbi:MAG: VWA domain-containing protein [Clostridium sp.]|nr:VWA domain-containing protein [Clostridium sp.]